MTKDQRAIVVEYISTLSEDDIRLLAQRLTDKLFGDVAEALNMMSKHPRMDSVLSSAVSAIDLFDFLDKTRDILNKEAKKKSPGLKPAQQ
jgi:hypothetical protein